MSATLTDTAGKSTTIALDLQALGVSKSAQLPSERYLRALVLGPPKAGKTTALCTAPKPLLINCDGRGAAMGAVDFCGQDFLSFDVTSRASWEKAQQVSKKLVDAGEVETVIVDTLTLLSDTLVDQLRQDGFQGFDMWREFDSNFRVGIKNILKLPAHVFLTAHIYNSHEDGAGVMPNIPGQAKEKIPGMVDQWLMFDFDPKRKPERQFILSPQENWKGGCRGARKADVCAANVPALFEALGVAA